MRINWCGYTWKCEMEGGRIIHPEYPWYWYSGNENVLVRMRNGEIHLYCKYNPKEVKHWDDKIYHPDYEVATMRSIKAFDFGTFSCEMKMPKGKNISASFWLSGAGNWPPEIDIEEGWTEEKKTWFRLIERYFPYIKPSWRTTTNVHFRDEQLNKTHLGSRNIPYCKQPKDPAEEFIKYECEWLPNSITFKANGKIVRQITDDTCRKLIKNIKDPEKGYKMNVVFNVWCENPKTHKIEQDEPLIIKNFKYEPMK